MSETIRVLLVEDNPGDAGLIRRMLKSELSAGTLELQHVTSLADSSQALRSGVVDVTLLDLELPGSTGIETINKICRGRSENAHCGTNSN